MNNWDIQAKGIEIEHTTSRSLVTKISNNKGMYMR